MSSRPERIGRLKIWQVLWGILVLLLGLTSVPLIVRLVHSDVVAAPSALLLPVFLLGRGIPCLMRRKYMPRSARSLILFCSAAFLTTVISLFFHTPLNKGQNPVSASVSAALTLLIGVCFYLAARLQNEAEGSFRFTLKCLDIGGAAVCIWTLLQAFFWYKDKRYPEWMKEIQFALSVGSLYRQRFVGFTLEPSWLAHQLNLLYLPWWFAAFITGYSAFDFRKGFLTVERVLFPIGALVLFLTLSRVGLGAFLLTVLFAALVLVYRVIRKRSERVADAAARRRITVLSFLGVLLLIAAAALGIIWLLTKLDFRMADLFSLRIAGRSDPIFYLAEKLSLAARFVYWDAGISIFDRYPLTGVGLGHAGFYMPEFLNDYALRLPEVRDLLFRSDTLLNIKSIWIRIPAETGIIGFSCFLVWYLQHFALAFKSLRSGNQAAAAAGWIGCFAAIAFLLEGFSLDTFALPYIWFAFGLSAARCDS